MDRVDRMDKVHMAAMLVMVDTAVIIEKNLQ
jgi:hypothetical protein